MVYRALTWSVLLACACAPAPEVQRPSPAEPVILTISYPARWLVEQLGPEKAKLAHLAPAGEDPVSWQPSGDLVAQMGQAALVVGNGKSYEKWLDTVSIPQGSLVLSAAEVKPIPLPGKTHSHGVEGEHSHVGIDPHTWMDPQSYALQAQAVHAGLVGVYPEETAVMDEKLRGLQAQLDALDKQTASLFNSLPPARYSANHPSYNYLFRRYNMEIRSFDVSPTKVPGPKELGEIQAWAQGDLPAVMLWESEPVGEIKAALGGIRHLVVDPIEQPVDGNYDYVSQARANLAAFTELGEGLRGQASGSQQGVGSQ